MSWIGVVAALALIIVVLVDAFEVMILPRYVRGVNSSDQWSFWQFGYPGMMVCGTGPWRNKNYHQPGDLPQTLDFERMAKSVVGIEAVIRQWTEGEKEGSKEGQ